MKRGANPFQLLQETTDSQPSIQEDPIENDVAYSRMLYQTLGHPDEQSLLGTQLGWQTVKKKVLPTTCSSCFGPLHCIPKSYFGVNPKCQTCLEAEINKIQDSKIPKIQEPDRTDDYDDYDPWATNAPPSPYPPPGTQDREFHRVSSCFNKLNLNLQSWDQFERTESVSNFLADTDVMEGVLRFLPFRDRIRVRCVSKEIGISFSKRTPKSCPATITKICTTELNDDGSVFWSIKVVVQLSDNVDGENSPLFEDFHLLYFTRKRPASTWRIPDPPPWELISIDGVKEVCSRKIFETSLEGLLIDSHLMN